MSTGEDAELFTGGGAVASSEPAAGAATPGAAGMDGFPDLGEHSSIHRTESILFIDHC